jgi:hypothetical protein
MEFKERMSKKSNQELIEIITKQRKDYQDEAILAAETEVRSRNLWHNEISDLITEYTQVEESSVKKKLIINLEKKTWSSIKKGIIIALILFFLIDLLYRLSIGNTFAPLHKLPVVFLLSYWYLKYQMRDSKNLKLPFWKGILTTLIFYIIVSTVFYLLSLLLISSGI